MFTPLVALICISHLISLCKAFAGPGACSGACGNAHDPALIRRSDGTYFRFSTGGKIAIHSAPSITGPWTFRGAAIPAGARINKEGRNDLWVSHTKYDL
jgi:arabinan endo-1,5-alpha-L-arabinosidase